MAMEQEKFVENNFFSFFLGGGYFKIVTLLRIEGQAKLLQHFIGGTPNSL